MTEFPPFSEEFWNFGNLGFRNFVFSRFRFLQPTFFAVHRCSPETSTDAKTSELPASRCLINSVTPLAISCDQETVLNLLLILIWSNNSRCRCLSKRRNPLHPLHSRHRRALAGNCPIKRSFFKFSTHLRSQRSYESNPIPKKRDSCIITLSEKIERVGKPAEYTRVRAQSTPNTLFQIQTTTKYSTGNSNTFSQPFFLMTPPSVASEPFCRHKCSTTYTTPISPRRSSQSLTW